MDKINKNKKTIIFALMAVVALTIIFSIVNQIESHSFKKWVYDKYAVGAGAVLTMGNPGITMVIVTIVITILLWGLFIGSAFKYSKSSSARVQGRKWPYIVMLIFGAASCIYGIYSFTKEGQGVVKFASTLDAAAKADILSKLDSSYSIIKVMNIIVVVLDAAITGLSIGGLLILDKAKKEQDLQMTYGVLQTGIDEANTQSKQKDVEENDLP